MVWVAVVRFGIPKPAAVITVLAFSAGAPLAVYGTQVYPELPAAFAVTLAIAALTGPLGRRSLLGAGVCIVALLVVVGEVRAGRGRARRRRRVALLAGRQAAAGVVVRRRARARRASRISVAHQAWYGGWTVYASGDHFVGGEMTVVGSSPDYPGRAVRLVGLLIDRDFGLVAWNPAYLCAVPALAFLIRKRPERWPVLAVPLAVGWLNATFVALTMHGWWWPGRQVVVVLPCAVLIVAWWAASSRTALRVLAVLGILGAFIFMWLVVEASVFDLRLISTMEQMSNPPVRGWRLLLPDYRDRTPEDWVLHGAWCFALIASVFAVVRPRRAVLRTRFVQAQKA